MLTREDLKSFAWTDRPGDQRIIDSNGEQIALLFEGYAGERSRLMASAPELALACARARDFLSNTGVLNDPPVREYAHEILAALDAALARAGVRHALAE